MRYITNLKDYFNRICGASLQTTGKRLNLKPETIQTALNDTSSMYHVVTSNPPSKHVLVKGVPVTDAPSNQKKASTPKEE